MRRRQVLATSTALLLAGCVSQGDGTTPATESEPADGTETATATSTATRTETATVDVDEQLVQPGVVTLNNPDSITVRDDGGQFLLVRVGTSDGPAPAQSEFALEVDGDEYRPNSYEYALFKNGNYGVEYTPESGTGWLVFALPEQVAPGEGRLRWSGGEAALSDRVRTRLETPSPPFDVTFEAPATVSEGDSPTLSIEVANEGEVAGTCMLALNRVGPDVAYAPVREVAVDLDGGESTTREFAARSPFDATGDPNEVTYHLDRVDGDRISRTIEPAE